MEKAALRKEIKSKLLGTEPSLLAQRSLFICENVIKSPVFQQAHTILCYAALPREADPAHLAKVAEQQGKRVAYPYCIDDHDMQALIPAHENGWETGAYGIRTPIRDRSKPVFPTEIDLIIVPGLAFDAFGGRLGRGKGYYDRYLSQTNAFALGFTFWNQIVPQVPMQIYDIKMNAVVTEKGMQYIENN